MFAPILRAAIARASAPINQGAQQYQLLLIICDGKICLGIACILVLMVVVLHVCPGVINDMSATIDALVEASVLPLSVVIIGVGDADFADMDRLDGDDGVLKNSRGEAAARDIVQFVPFSKYGVGRHSELAKEVLAEIPAQFLSYMQSKNIVPNPPVSAPSDGVFDAPPSYEETKQAV